MITYCHACERHVDTNEEGCAVFECPIFSDNELETAFLLGRKEKDDG